MPTNTILRLAFVLSPPTEITEEVDEFLTLFTVILKVVLSPFVKSIISFDTLAVLSNEPVFDELANEAVKALFAQLAVPCRLPVNEVAITLPVIT